jgi:hypothetical protein
VSRLAPNVSGSTPKSTDILGVVRSASALSSGTFKALQKGSIRFVRAGVSARPCTVVDNSYARSGEEQDVSMELSAAQESAAAEYDVSIDHAAPMSMDERPEPPASIVQPAVDSALSLAQHRDAFGEGELALFASEHELSHHLRV